VLATTAVILKQLLSQEGLARAIQREARSRGWFKLHGAVNAFTIRRIERDGHCPSERVRLVIALYFGCQPRDIWEPQNRRTAPPVLPTRKAAVV